MEETRDGAPTKKPVIDKERLRKRFFGDAHRTAPKRAAPESSKAQQTATAHQKADQKADQKASNDRATEDRATTNQESNEALLERLAAQELLQEAARGKVRAEVAGPTAWKKRRLKPNLRFMANSILQTEGQNRRKSRQFKKDNEFI